MVLVTMSFYDRHLLLLLPFVIAAALTRLHGMSLSHLASATLLLVGVGYSQLLHLDNYDYSRTRW